MLAVEAWVEVSGPQRAEGSSVLPTEHKGVQTEPEKPIHQTNSCGLLERECMEITSTDLEIPTEGRSLEECLLIYKSQVKMCLFWVSLIV
jgi:hypothetical protein